MNIQNSYEKINYEEERNEGITLIALVVTVIVLLILAGISLNMLSGENGILKRASEAKENTENANKDEQRKLAQAEALMSSEDTIYNGTLIPQGFAPTKIAGEDSVDVGLVITDGYGNEYVWIEVPKTIYSDSRYNKTNAEISEDDFEKIRECLKEYTADYTDSSYKDTNLDGITYSNNYKSMIKSIYINGGFWIGRYEVGIEDTSPRKAHTVITNNDKVVIQSHKFPYNWVTKDEAQTLAVNMNYKNCTSSLVYGLQWDLILKYIETKKVTEKNDLISNSTLMGNYNDNLWNITSKQAKYSIDYGDSFINCPYKKAITSNVLLTTGESSGFSLMNIYDIAGNVNEWTLEFYSEAYPCVYRGGSYYNSGSSYPAKYRNYYYDNYCLNDIGFRIGLWK